MELQFELVLTLFFIGIIVIGIILLIIIRKKFFELLNHINLVEEKLPTKHENILTQNTFYEESKLIHMELEKLKSRVNNLLATYPKEEEAKEANKWINKAEDKASSNGDDMKNYVLETALARYPGNKDLFNYYTSNLMGLIEYYLSDQNNRELCKNAITRLNQKAESFLRHCAIEDWDYGIEIKNKVQELGDNYLESLKEEKVKATEYNLDHLDNILEDLAENSDQAFINDFIEANKEQLTRFLEIDNIIDKNFIKQNNALKRKYEDIHKKLNKFLQDVEKRQNESNNIERIDYNQKVITAAEKIYNELAQCKFKINDENEIKKIADYLGGWDQSLLNFYTASYLSFVYSKIFSEIKTQDKLTLTNYMIEKEREVGQS